MNTLIHRFSAGAALLMLGLSLILAVSLTASPIARATPGVLFAAPAEQGSGTPPIVDVGAYEAQYVDVALSKAVLPSTVAPGRPITFPLTLNNADVGEYPVVLRVTDSKGAFADRSLLSPYPKNRVAISTSHSCPGTGGHRAANCG